jgi:hypothetical protein
VGALRVARHQIRHEGHPPGVERVEGRHDEPPNAPTRSVAASASSTETCDSQAGGAPRARCSSLIGERPQTSRPLTPIRVYVAPPLRASARRPQPMSAVEKALAPSTSVLPRSAQQNVPGA